MDMKGLGKKSLVLVCGLACLLAGCTASERGRTLAEAVLTEVKAAGMDTEADENESGRELLQAMMKLPGMKDKETAGLFGGGEENWTEDRSFYVGRVYQTELYGGKYKVFTTCGEDPDRTVESVSIWIVNGEREIAEAETEQWIEAIPDSQTRRIFRMRFLDGMILEQIGKKMHVDKSTVSRKIENFLKFATHATNATL